MAELLKLDGDELFEGNREYQREPVLIEERDRTADGTLRVDEIAIKQTFSVSWSHLPASDIDGALGRDSLLASFEAGGSHTLEVAELNTSPNTYTVRFSSYSEKVVWRRGTSWVYAVSVQFEEI